MAFTRTGEGVGRPLAQVDGDISLSMKTLAGQENAFRVGRGGLVATAVVPLISGISEPLSTMSTSEIVKVRRLLVRLEGVTTPDRAAKLAIHVNPRRDPTSLTFGEESYVGTINLVPIELSSNYEVEFTRKLQAFTGSVRDLRVVVLAQDRQGRPLEGEIQVQGLTLILR